MTAAELRALAAEISADKTGLLKLAATADELRLLAHRVSRSTDSPRLLADRVLIAFGWSINKSTFEQVQPSVIVSPLGDVTRMYYADNSNPLISLDLANALVPNGWRVLRVKRFKDDLWVWFCELHNEKLAPASAYGYTEGHARVAAALTARAAVMEIGQ